MANLRTSESPVEKVHGKDPSVCPAASSAIQRRRGDQDGGQRESTCGASPAEAACNVN
jgi:hypothetical protein